MQTSTLTSPELIIGLSAERAYQEVTHPHVHLRAQVLYASEGTIQVFSGDQMWIVPRKCAMWIPARVEHSMRCLSQVTLNTALIDAEAAQVMGQTCRLIRVSNLLHALLIRLNQFDQHNPLPSPRSSELSNALQTLIFDEIQKASTLAIHIPWPNDKRLSRMCQALLDAPDQRKDLNIWADEIGTSSRTLMRLFQKQTGLSYRAWLQHSHIVLALSKMTEGSSISVMAKSLGYASVSAFSAMFKRHMGITPQQFKQQN